MKFLKISPTKSHWPDWGIGFIMCCALYAHVAHYIPYQLCELEHESLFVNDADTWQRVWQMPGGLADVSGAWATQFFALPYIGVFVYLLPVLLLWPVAVCLARRAGASSFFVGVAAFGVVVTQLFVQYDFYFFASGSIALLAALTVLCGVSRIKSARQQCVAFASGMPLVAWLFGAVVAVYALCGAVLFFSRRSRLFGLAVSVAVFCATVGIGYWSGYVENVKLFLSPEFYHHPMMEFAATQWMAWIYLLLFALAVRLFPSVGVSWKFLRRIVAVCCLWAVVAGCFLHFDGRFRNTSNQTLWRLNHYSFTEDWNGMLTFLSAQRPLTNQLYMNYANMALAHTGDLGDYAFYFQPRGPHALMVEANSNASVYMLLSDVQYTVGGVADAQRYAFEAQTALPRMCGVQTLMRLVKTNLILGHDAVAEKYLSLLDKTLFYKTWAQRYRRFLGNPKALMADPELGEKRRALTAHNHFIASQGWTADLEEVLAADPSNRKVATYLGLSYLLAKDMPGFCAFLEKYYGTAALNELPLAFQQGVVTAYPQDEEKQKIFGIRPQVREHYVRFMAQLQQAQGRSAGAPQMSEEDMYSFWYYYLFV